MVAACLTTSGSVLRNSLLCNDSFLCFFLSSLFCSLLGEQDKINIMDTKERDAEIYIYSSDLFRGGGLYNKQEANDRREREKKLFSG